MYKFEKYLRNYNFHFVKVAKKSCDYFFVKLQVRKQRRVKQRSIKEVNKIQMKIKLS